MNSSLLASVIGLLLLASAASSSVANAEPSTYPEFELAHQPTVTGVEAAYATSAYGTSLSNPNGTPWCGGRPTFWVVGHEIDQPHAEVPWCQSLDGSWSADSAIGSAGLPSSVNRKDCVSLDVNGDGDEDIICAVSPMTSLGLAENELHITKPDGSLQKEAAHGLQKYPSLASQYIATLKAFDGSDLIFVATTGTARSDGKTNHHRMFRVVPSATDSFFEEVSGPWISHFSISSKPVVADIDGDGRDDLIVFDKNGGARIYIQDGAAGSWSEVSLPSFRLTQRWTAARVDFLTQVDRPDLVIAWEENSNTYLHVFGGIEEAPYFDFRRPVYSQRLDSVASDIEIVDINKDRKNDIYVVQTQNGCNKDYDAYPILNRQRDIVLLGKGSSAPTTRSMFTKIKMDFKGRGCGGLVRKFGDDAVILTEGSSNHVGFNYLLRWDQF